MERREVKRYLEMWYILQARKHRGAACRHFVPQAPPQPAAAGAVLSEAALLRTLRRQCAEHVRLVCARRALRGRRRGPGRHAHPCGLPPQMRDIVAHMPEAGVDEAPEEAEEEVRVGFGAC